MSHGGDAESVARASLVAAMWSYAALVFEPLHTLRAAGLAPRPAVPEGWPDAPAAPGLGTFFSKRYERPVLIEVDPASYPLVEEFDRMAEVYDSYVRPFSVPLFEEALALLQPLIHPAARLLDAGCGAGRELERTARLVPDGEVVGVDLAAGMVNAAWRNARAHGLRNTAFFQADVGALPRELHGVFDVVYNSLAHHHYPDPRAAAASILDVLRPGGVYCVVDPGPAWFNRSASALAQWSDPGWIGFHTPEEFRTLFLATGFAQAMTTEVLPGFCVSLGVKAS